MNALIFDGPWQMRLADLPTPRPQDHEVLLRSTAAGICGSDVHGFTGESGRRQPGMVMGHEAVGEVVELGPKVTRLRQGERVAVYNIHACGRCHHCAAGQEQRCPDKKVLGVDGIRVTMVSPGWIMTERQLTEKVSPEIQNQLKRETATGRLLDEPHVTPATLFLLSAAASGISGQNLVVDGGKYMQRARARRGRLSSGSMTFFSPPLAPPF